MLSMLFALLGLVSFSYRLKIWRRRSPLTSSAVEGPWPKVSIVIPCRNEEKNLPALLHSLRKLDYPDFELIVVDDNSEDHTFALAKLTLGSFPNADVVRAGEKPLNWGGKNWPCAVGAKLAQGTILLFTDADTIHMPGSLKASVSYFVSTKAEMLSAPPYHRCLSSWERMLCLFYILPLIASAYADVPKQKRLFSIGQYLMFSRESYLALQGHTAVAESLAEDLDLAKRWLSQNRRFEVYPNTDLYQVQMFGSFQTFTVGWIRLLRLGLARTTLLSFLEVSFVCYLFAFCPFEQSYLLKAVSALGYLGLIKVQKHFGNFSLIGILFAPVSVFLFLVLTVWAVVESGLRKEIQWHGRSYQS